MDLVPIGSQVAPSLEQIARVGAGYDGSGGKDLRTLLRQLCTSTGINTIHQVNDTETIADWTESAGGVFDAANDTAGRVGTNETKMTSTGACDGTQYLQTLFIDGSKEVGASPANGRKHMDWSDTRYLGFWVTNKSNGDFSDAGEMKVTIVNNGVEQTQVNVQAIVDDVHQYMQIDMEANGWDRTLVESLRFYANVGSGEDLYVNNIERYEIAFGRGPMYGAMFPLKSGTTLTDGALANWSVDGAVVGADAVTGLGPCKLFSLGAPKLPYSGTALGVAARNVWAMFPGKMLVILRAGGTTIAGEGVIYSAAGVVIGQATGDDENSIGKCLEAAGAANDDIFCLLDHTSTFIS